MVSLCGGLGSLFLKHLNIVRFELSFELPAKGQPALKVQDFQKKIGIIDRLKQICCFTILNSLFEFLSVLAT
jgi:hypothetical protein